MNNLAKLNTEYKLVRTDIFYNADSNSYSLYLEDIDGKVVKIETKRVETTKSTLDKLQEVQKQEQQEYEDQFEDEDDFEEDDEIEGIDYDTDDEEGNPFEDMDLSDAVDSHIESKNGDRR